MALETPEVVADEFEAAFAKFATPPEEKTPETVSLLDPPPVTEEKKVEDAAAAAAAEAAKTATTTADGEIEGLTDEEKAAAATAAAAEAAKKPVVSTESKTTDDDLLKRFAKIVQDAQPAVKQPDAEKKVETQPQPVMSMDDAQTLQKFEKDYPEMANAMLIVNRAMTTQLLSHIMGEFNKALTARDEILQELGVRQQESDLVSAVPDYHDIHDKVTAWVKTQPKYLQGAYEHVIANGTADEVVDLIGQWRASTGTAAPAARASGGTPPKVDTELSTAAKKAAAALAPVTSKRTVTPASANDPNDFDGAFERFAAVSAGKT